MTAPSDKELWAIATPAMRASPDYDEVICALRAVWAAATQAAAGEPHCPSCICGKRAPVQWSRDRGKGPGSITWAEHLRAWSGYAAQYGNGQTAERVVERGGFSYGELVMFLGRDPETWEPRKG